MKLPPYKKADGSHVHNMEEILCKVTMGRAYSQNCMGSAAGLTVLLSCRGEQKYENFAGDAYAQVAISTNVWPLVPCCPVAGYMTSDQPGAQQDVYKTAEAVKAAGGKITREPGPLPGM